MKVRVWINGQAVELEVAGPLSTKGAKSGKKKGGEVSTLSLVGLVAINPETRCWEWLRRKNRWGYAAAKRDGRTVEMHRYVYEQLERAVPAGLELDHICRNRGCVNPDHLEPVTHSENMRRGDLANRRKTHCPQGHAYAEHAYLWRGRRYCRVCQEARSLVYHLERGK